MSKTCVTAADFAAKRAEEEERKRALEIAQKYGAPIRAFCFDAETVNDEGK